MEPTKNGAWIEWNETGPLELKQSCSIGRAPTNQVVLASDKVSRRHAVINEEGSQVYQIMDLGSANGTFVNGRRVTQATALRDRDVIEIGPFKVTFRQPGNQGSAETPGSVSYDKTVQQIKGGECWLVLADLESSTALSRRLKPEELPAVTGGWFNQCRSILERHGGAIDNCLGDGFLAYWHSRTGVAEQVAAALRELKVMRDASELPFRLVIHFGQVFAGGTTASGVEKFFGPEINFIFKFERLASTLGEKGLLSAPAHERLKGKLEMSALGEHEVAGFPGKFSFYGF